jgi:hypothetical protein
MAATAFALGLRGGRLTHARPNPSREGTGMNVIRAHDFLPTAPAPNLRRLARILHSFVATGVFCAAMCALTILRAPKTPVGAAVHCMCMGKCMR